MSDGTGPHGLTTLPAITIRHPYALLVALGIKPLENRGWSPHATYIGKPMAIHAGQWFDSHDVLETLIELSKRALVPAPLGREPYEYCRELTRKCAASAGAVVAVGTLERVCSPLQLAPEDAQRWRTAGSVGWVFRDVVAFASPVVAKGAQSTWHLPLIVDDRVRAEWQRSRARAAP